jgi:hypothetical protein
MYPRGQGERKSFDAEVTQLTLVKGGWTICSAGMAQDEQILGG